MQIGLPHALTDTSKLIVTDGYERNTTTKETISISCLHMAYYISQLIQYSRACGSYQDFLDRR